MTQIPGYAYIWIIKTDKLNRNNYLSKAFSAADINEWCPTVRKKNITFTNAYNTAAHYCVFNNAVSGKRSYVLSEMWKWQWFRKIWPLQKQMEFCRFTTFTTLSNNQSTAPEHVKLTQNRMTLLSLLQGNQQQLGNHPINLIFTHKINMKQKSNHFCFASNPAPQAYTNKSHSATRQL
jgi:hypothetical protein